MSKTKPAPATLTPANAFSAGAEALIQDFASARRIQANVLLLTLFGDTICPYGGTIWLGSLIKLVQPLGISERLVRTSVYRLTEQGVLTSESIGRRSYYTLTGRGQRQFTNAAKRIYATAPPPWDGHWQLVLTGLGALDNEQRDGLHKELTWLGFSRLADGLHVHPSIEATTLYGMLDDRQLRDQVIVMQASSGSGDAATISNRLLASCFDTTATDALYQDYIATFQPLLHAARHSGELKLELCFLVRSLLIHRYRYILLREPELPHELQAEAALSLQARRLTAELYLLLSPQSDAHFLRMTETGNGGFKQPDTAYYQRFGGNP